MPCLLVGNLLLDDSLFLLEVKSTEAKISSIIIDKSTTNNTIVVLSSCF